LSLGGVGAGRRDRGLGMGGLGKTARISGQA